MDAVMIGMVWYIHIKQSQDLDIVALYNRVRVEVSCATYMQVYTPKRDGNATAQKQSPCLTTRPSDYGCR